MTAVAKGVSAPAPGVPAPGVPAPGVPVPGRTGPGGQRGAPRSSYEELTRHLNALGAVRRGLARDLPQDCPPASAAVLMLLRRFGEMRAGRLAELLAIDVSVTSRHVAHVAAHGWIERRPDPADGRSRLLRISGAGEELLEELAARTAETLRERLAEWDESDLVMLNSLLEKLRSSFGDCGVREHR